MNVFFIVENFSYFLNCQTSLQWSFDSTVSKQYLQNTGVFADGAVGIL